MAATKLLSLEGTCDCGRNQYTVELPSPNPSDLLQIRFDHSSPSLQRHSSPASVFLRVPLTSLRSTTYAFFPDEKHADIRRSYTSPRHASSKKFFCGICAELLSVWSEEDGEQDYINLSWRTLGSESKDAVDELGLLPEHTGEDRRDLLGMEVGALHGLIDKSEVILAREIPDVEPPVGQIALRARSRPWYDEMLRGSTLGSLRRRKGFGISADGSRTVEWEIVEYYDSEDDPDGQRTAKRQLVSRDEEQELP